jgi:hypothetical protein
MGVVECFRELELELSDAGMLIGDRVNAVCYNAVIDASSKIDEKNVIV